MNLKLKKILLLGASAAILSGIHVQQASADYTKDANVDASGGPVNYTLDTASTLDGAHGFTAGANDDELNLNFNGKVITTVTAFDLINPDDKSGQKVTFTGGGASELVLVNESTTIKGNVAGRVIEYTQSGVKISSADDNAADAALIFYSTTGAVGDFKLELGNGAVIHQKNAATDAILIEATQYSSGTVDIQSGATVKVDGSGNGIALQIGDTNTLTVNVAGKIEGKQAVKFGNSAITLAYKGTSDITGSTELGGNAGTTLVIEEGAKVTGDITAGHADQVITIQNDKITGGVKSAADGNGQLVIDAKSVEITGDLGTSGANQLAKATVNEGNTLLAKGNLYADAVILGKDTVLEMAGENKTIGGTIDADDDGRGFLKISDKTTVTGAIGGTKTLDKIEVAEGKELITSAAVTAGTLTLNKDAKLSASGALDVLIDGAAENTGEVVIANSLNLEKPIGSTKPVKDVKVNNDQTLTLKANVTAEAITLVGADTPVLTIGAKDVTVNAPILSGNGNKGKINVNEDFTTSATIGTSAKKLEEIIVADEKAFTVNHALGVNKVTLTGTEGKMTIATADLDLKNLVAIEGNANDKGVLDINASADLSSTTLGATSGLSAVNINGGVTTIKTTFKADDLTVKDGATLKVDASDNRTINQADSGTFTLAGGGSLDYTGSANKSMTLTIEHDKATLAGSVALSVDTNTGVATLVKFTGANAPDVTGAALTLKLDGAHSKSGSLDLDLLSSNVAFVGADKVVVKTNQLLAKPNLEVSLDSKKVTLKSLAKDSEGFSKLQTVQNSPSLGVAKVLETAGEYTLADLETGTKPLTKIISHYNKMSEDTVAQALTDDLTPNHNNATAVVADAVSSSAMQNIASRMGSPVLLASNTASGMSGVAAGDAGKPYGVWVRAIGEHSKQKDMDDRAGFKLKGRGFTVGGDMATPWAEKVGLAFSYAKSDVKHNKGVTKVDVDSFMINAYGEFRPLTNHNFFLDGVLGYAYHDIDQDRKTFENKVAKAKYNSHYFVAQLIAGHDFVANQNFVVSPALGLRVGSSNDKSYTEKNGGDANLTVNSHRRTVFTVSPQIRFAYATKINPDWEFSPQLLLRWNHDFGKRTPNYTARFAVLQDSPFSTKGMTQARGSIDVGASAVFASTQGVEFSLNYNAHLRKKYRGHAVGLEAKYRF